MAFRNPTLFSFLLFSILVSTLPSPGTGAKDTLTLHHFDPNFPSKGWEGGEGFWRWKERSARRLMIGSIAPTCTYNECRGCRFKCRAEQVPVDANDPVNSAYRYRCVCHR